MKQLLAGYKDLFTLLSSYWGIYGGFRAVLLSPFFHLSLLITCFMGPLWLKARWIDLATDVIPNMLGFALGGYAILVVFGDERFIQIISGSPSSKKASPFMGINAAFLHFILIQLLALMAALVISNNPVSLIPVEWKICVYKQLPELKSALPYIKNSVHFIGSLLYVYAITLGLAAALAIFRVSRWFDTYQQKKKQASSSQNQ
ncbi:hypothetical protein [Endozoicomonas sp. YOMI1]|uniref:hypothetical protein n=1 Tax=Endozoicomonas sp. YOMI1 TaxID=2828739 RepID=UPI002147AE8F|nr:hypothetical protein [Endozoicomonas sp. YOMI1]